jgi:uncharacterized UPF0160 family protein
MCMINTSIMRMVQPECRYDFTKTKRGILGSKMHKASVVKGCLWCKGQMLQRSKAEKIIVREIWKQKMASWH